MNKTIISLCLFAGLWGLSSCKEDDKTILQDPTTFVLNTPAYAANYVYDLEKSKSIELTCSQPDYGYTAVTTYQVQVSLNNDFTGENFETLATTYNQAKMEVDASEVAVAATNLSILAGKEESDFPYVGKIYTRLVASVANGMNQIASNAVELPKCRIHFALPPVLLPATMNIIGSGVGGWTWGSDAVEMVPVHSHDEIFWRMVYIEKDGEIKFNENKDWDGGEFGYANTKFGGTMLESAGVSDNGGNIKVATGGWYLLVVRTEMEGRTRVYTVEFNEPNVYLMGDAAGNWDCDPEDLFTVPATKQGDFVSPAVSAVPGEGGLRMCVKLPDADWWQTEFIFFNGQIEYRAKGDDQDRITAAVGQKAYLNFMTGAASLK